MNIKFLRQNLSFWHWTPERFGFGWRYVGTNIDNGYIETVTAYPVARLIDEDEFRTEWMVSFGGKEIPFWSFFSRAEVRNAI